MRACFAVAALAVVARAAVEADPAAALQARVKDIEAMSAQNGISVFSFRLAGLVTASQSAYATAFMRPADIDVGKAFSTACTEDINTLTNSVCIANQEEPAHRGLPDVFKTNLNTMQCLSDNFPVVSDVCVDAAHTAAAYIFSNKDVLNLSMKQVAVKDVFEGFKVSCASEVARACPGGLLDPSAAVATLPKAPVKGDRHHGHHHRRQLHGGPQEGSFDPLDQLSSSLGTCVRDVAPRASDTCAPAIDALVHVSRFVTGRGGEDGGHRSLFRGGPDNRLRGDDEPSSSSEEEEDDDHDRRKSRKNKDAGGFVGLVLIVALVSMSVCLCRRRRQLRDLRARVHQLELMLAGGNVAGMRPVTGVAVGVPMQNFAAAPQRVASDAVAEDAGLLHQQQQQQQAHLQQFHPNATVVMPHPYPGQAYPARY